jgi:predicted phosphodiesterase
LLPSIFKNNRVSNEGSSKNKASLIKEASSSKPVIERCNFLHLLTASLPLKGFWMSTKSKKPSSAKKVNPKPVQAQQVLKKVVVLSDVHIPEHDEGAWAASVRFIADIKPEYIILNGDFLEMESCSQHGGSPHIVNIENDFKEGFLAVNELRNAAPNAKIVYLEGNHETRLHRFILSKAPSLFKSLSIPAGLSLKELNIEYIEEDQQPYSIGALDILHGHQMMSLPKHHAAKANDIYGASGRTVVFGHSHRPQVHSKPGLKQNEKSIALGCLRTKDPKWMHGQKSGWQHQILLAYVQGEQLQTYPIDINDGHFIWAGKMY